MSSITFNVDLPDSRKNAVKISKFKVRFVCKHDKLSNFLYESSQFPAVKFLHFAQKFSPVGMAESPFKGANPPFFPLPTESYIIYNSVLPVFPSFGKKYILSFYPGGNNRFRNRKRLAAHAYHSKRARPRLPRL